MSDKRGLQMSPQDDVVTLLAEVHAGDEVVIIGKKTGAAVGTVHALDAVPIYHKLALRDIRAGESVHKYGEIIGVATADIKRGSHVHIHNIESAKTRNHD